MVLIIWCIGWLWDIWIQRNCSGFLNLPNNKNHLNVFLTSSQVPGHGALSSCRNGRSSGVITALRRERWRSHQQWQLKARVNIHRKGKMPKKISEAQGQSPQTLRLPTLPLVAAMIASCCSPGWGRPIPEPCIALNMKTLPEYQHLNKFRWQTQKSDASLQMGGID